MGNSIINWTEQWLTDRRQRVDVDGEVSSWKSVSSANWICTRAYFSFGIQLYINDFRGRGNRQNIVNLQMTLNCLAK